MKIPQYVYLVINCRTYTDQLCRFDIIRQNFYTASNLKDLFHNIHFERIISFMHAIGRTNKLQTVSGHDIDAVCMPKMPLNPYKQTN